MLLRRKHIEENDHNTGTDRYLITYADLITLLLGLFVILYAAAQIDEEKYKEVKEAFSQIFKTKSGKVLEGGTGVLSGTKNSIPEPILPVAKTKSLEEISRETEKALGKYIEKGFIQLKLTSKGLILTLPEKLLFESGKAEIQNDGLIVLDTLSQILKNIDKQIFVDGHTDSDPIRSFRYESNWHLSVARALNVGYKLVRLGVPEYNLSIRGYASQRPVADNSTTAGKAQNRRVEITISEKAADAPSTQGYSDSDTLQNQ